MISHSATLPRLDSWYSDRVRRNYTVELGERTYQSIEKAATALIPSSQRAPFLEIARQYKDPTKVFSGSKRVFSRIIPPYTAMMRNPEEVRRQAGMGRDIFDEYFLPALKTGKPLLDFAEVVDTKMVLKRGLIESRDIDHILVNKIGDRSDVARFVSSLFQAIPVASCAIRLNGAATRDSFVILDDMCNAVAFPVKGYFMEIFRDLPEN